MEHISDVQLNTIRTALNAQLDALPEPPDDLHGFQEPHDFTDAATVLSEQSHSVKDWQRIEEKRIVVQSALERIDDGDFGECEDCGDEIPVGRLLANPLATRCVECQEAAEVKGPVIRKGLLDEFDPLT